MPHELAFDSQTGHYSMMYVGEAPWHGLRIPRWSTYNGIIEFIDQRQLKQNPDQQLNSIRFGDGYLLKARTYRLAVDHFKTWAAWQKNRAHPFLQKF